jgi:hypothetical protein
MTKLQEKGGWKNLPKGWHDKSVKKFGKSLVKGGAKKEGFFDKCVDRMRGHVKNPEGFCAGVKDKSYGSTHWRGKGKSEKEVTKDVKQHQNVKHEGLVSVYLEMLECGCDDPKYGNDPDPLATLGTEYADKVNDLYDHCLNIECPIQRMKCLQLMKALGLDRDDRADREIEAITGNYEPSGEI